MRTGHLDMMIPSGRVDMSDSSTHFQGLDAPSCSAQPPGSKGQGALSRSVRGELGVSSESVTRSRPTTNSSI